MIGGVFAVIGVVVTLGIAYFQGDDAPAQAAPTTGTTASTNIANPPLTNPVPVTTVRTATPVGSGAANSGSPNETAGDGTIGRFEIIPKDEKKQVGDHEFLAMPGNKSSFAFDIKTADGYDIPKCTVRGFLVYSTGEKEPLVSSVNCPSQSVYTVTQTALKPGSYKIVATAFVPGTNEQAQAEYAFTVVPSS
jgi:hypothetical protein